MNICHSVNQFITKRHRSLTAVFVGLSWLAYIPGVFAASILVEPGTDDIVLDVVLRELGLLSKVSYSIVSTIGTLFAERNYFLGATVAIFSILFPVYKLLTFTRAFLVKAISSPLLAQLSLWSLLDVFVISILVVSLKQVLGTRVEPGAGIYFFTCSVLFLYCAIKLNEIDSRAAGKIVRQRLEAFNTGEIDTLTDMHSQDAELMQFPSTVLAGGRTEIREHYQSSNMEDKPKAKVIFRLILGHRIIDCETVTKTGPEGRVSFNRAVIYDIEGEKIKRAWLISEPDT